MSVFDFGPYGYVHRGISGSTPYILSGKAVCWKMFTFLQIDHRCLKMYGRSSSWWSRKSGQGTQWISVVHGCQWVMSFESDAGWCWLPGSELQHPELNYGPGISGELRVTHDSHQEPHPGGVREMELFFFFGEGGTPPISCQILCYCTFRRKKSNFWIALFLTINFHLSVVNSQNWTAALWQGTQIEAGEKKERRVQLW